MKKYSKDINKKIDESTTAKELVKNPVRVFIDNMGPNVNTIYPDYSPIINADESVMFFTSRREGTTGGEKAPDDMQYYEDIYISYNNNGVWSQAINPGKPLNTKRNDATVGLSPDGQTLLIYKGYHGGDIYQCKLNGNHWGKPKSFTQNDQ